jgi:hypothetical protein
MEKILPLLLVVFSTNSFAALEDQCDPGTIEQETIQAEGEDIPAVVCKQGEDLLILPDRPVKTTHLIYGGVNIGMPYLGVGLTYAQMRDNRQKFHLSTNLEGSLGSNGVSVQAGLHPWGNSLYAGGTTRYYNGLPGEFGYQLGPSLGISTAGKRVAGHVSISYLAGYDSRMGGLNMQPEVSLGLRIRLFKK